MPQFCNYLTVIERVISLRLTEESISLMVHTSIVPRQNHTIKLILLYISKKGPSFCLIYTCPSVQCAAVSTQSGLMRVPPQNCRKNRSDPVPRVRATCQGTSPKVAAVPPTILFCRSVAFRSVRLPLKECAQVSHPKKYSFLSKLHAAQR